MNNAHSSGQRKPLVIVLAVAVVNQRKTPHQVLDFFHNCEWF